mmetsp:Transcript_97688/g.262491  ORF Transcript_97688/g.262491 Transcript_97688/m.262491 type:complete len:433 (-) Transcript_97688:104-1402(-)
MDLSVQRGSHEFSVSNGAAAVCVHARDYPLDVRLSLGDPELRQASSQLVSGDQAVAVAVEADELIPQLVQLRVLHLHSDDLQQRLFQWCQHSESAQPLDVEGVEAARPSPAGRCVGDPAAMQSLLGGVAGVSVDAHEVLDEALGFGRHGGPDGLHEVVSRLTDLPHDLDIAPATEGFGARQQNVHHDAGAPQVALAAILAPKDFRGDVVRGAQNRAERLLLAAGPRRAEVDELQDVVRQGTPGLQQEVLGLHVAVDDVRAVQVRERPEGILHNGRGLGLAEALLRRGPQSVEELTPLAELHDEKDLLVALEGLMEPDDVGMVKLLHDGHLLLEVCDIDQKLLHDLLHGSHLARGHMHGTGDLPEGTLSQFAGSNLVELLNAARLVEDELRPVDALSGEGPLAACPLSPRLTGAMHRRGFRRRRRLWAGDWSG